MSRIAMLALAAMCSACASATVAEGAHSPTSVSRVSPAPGCHSGAPEAGVYQPDRLRVLDPCKHAMGVIVDVAHEDDGDYHLWFTPDAGYEYLLNSENHFQGRPAMLGEVTPDCPGNPSDARAAAGCPNSPLPIPVIGDHVAMDGPWVFDTNHGWQEIHPVDFIEIVGHA